MMYKFYGADNCDVSPIVDNLKIHNPKELYDVLQGAWKKETCAPRMQERWTEENKTLGQCSITAFLVQDLFGGQVYGVLLPDGNYHCFNVIGKALFDLTSEQFQNQKLEYTLNYPQSREVHFKKEEKYQRYIALKNDVIKHIF